jgi:hypothetical protein
VDFAYISPKGRGRSSGRKHLRSRLKYTQYRDSRDIHIPQRGLVDRWQDHGLGNHYRAILENCATLSSKHVLAWTWVISPSPELMALVPEDMRRDLIIDLTERVVETYYHERGSDVPEYAFVVHDRLTNDENDGSPALQQLHTHVFLPGTAPTIAGRTPFYNNKDKEHERLIHEVATQHFDTALDNILGREWRDRIQQQEISPELPETDDLDAWFPRER